MKPNTIIVWNGIVGHIDMLKLFFSNGDLVRKADEEEIIRYYIRP